MHRKIFQFSSDVILFDIMRFVGVARFFYRSVFAQFSSDEILMFAMRFVGVASFFTGLFFAQFSSDEISFDMRFVDVARFFTGIFSPIEGKLWMTAKVFNTLCYMYGIIISVK